ncbi:MAG: hypothetical protein ACE5GB_15765 [Acidimicrobiales bacterium]
MEDFDDLWSELVEIEAAFSATAEDDYETRSRLQARKDTVKSRMTLHIELHERPKNRRAIETELAARRAQLEAHMRTRINVVYQMGGGRFSGGALTGSGDENTMNLRIDEAAGRADIERRIAELRAMLAQLDREEGRTPLGD